MKIVIAKIVYYVGLVAMVGIGFGSIAALGWFFITTIPFALAIIAALLALTGFGMLFGWAEDTINKSNRYKSSGEKFGGK
jgi:hypothetical protein